MDPPAVYISLARWERVKVREEFGTGCVRFSLARWERVRVREEFEKGRVCFSLAHWERVRVREDSIRDTSVFPSPVGRGTG